MRWHRGEVGAAAVVRAYAMAGDIFDLGNQPGTEEMVVVRQIGNAGTRVAPALLAMACRAMRVEKACAIPQGEPSQTWVAKDGFGICAHEIRPG